MRGSAKFPQDSQLSKETSPIRAPLADILENPKYEENHFTITDIIKLYF
jgi:hypothetical protein